MLWTTWLVTGEMKKTTETERRNIESSDRQEPDYTRFQKDVGMVCCLVGIILFVTVLMVLL